MRVSIAGMAAQIFILFISLIILPIYFMSIIQYYKDINRIQVAERNLVDYVIDNRQVSNECLAEFNIALAGVTTPVKADIQREIRVINPSHDPSAERAEVTWAYTEWDTNTLWYQGDLITVSVKQEGSNLMQQISQLFLGSDYNKLDNQLVAMVR